MTEHDQNPERAPLSRRMILMMTGGAAGAAALVLLGAVLPAEYNVDPLGLGKAMGLSRLWAPPEVTYQPGSGAQSLSREYATPFRTDVIDIPLEISDDPERRDQLEYKVRMKEGATLVFSWVAEGAPSEEFYSDFHSHTQPEPGAEMVVATHKQAIGGVQNGSLVAPFDGIHGWYLQNQSLSRTTVRLRLAGFYELIPPGQDGNEARIPAPAG